MRRRVIVWGLVAVAAGALASLAAISQARVGRRVVCAPATPLPAGIRTPVADLSRPSDTHNLDAVAASVDEREPNDAAVIAEILEIRRQQGVQVLNDAFLDETSASDLEQPGHPVSKFLSDDFSSALRRVAANSTSSVPAVADTKQEACQQEFDRSLQNGDDDQLIAALLCAGRHLDRRADELEEARQFQHADRLRHLAHRLRKEARAIDGGQVSGPSALTNPTRNIKPGPSG